MKRYLWIYIEQKGMSPVMYNTFLTKTEAKNLFAGKYHYARVTLSNILEGIACEP